MTLSHSSMLKVGSLTLLTACLFTGCATPQQNRIDPEEALIQSFSKLTTASVSDAVDQIVGQRGFMSHEIKPLFRTKLCGRAITVLAKPSTESRPPSMALEFAPWVLNLFPGPTAARGAFDDHHFPGLGRSYRILPVRFPPMGRASILDAF